MTTSAALVRISTRPLLDLESFCRGAGLHPDFVRRLLALGLLEAEPGPAAGELRFAPSQLAAAARLQRLRSGLGLNYAGLGLVVDLLDRVAALEAALRRRTAHAPLPQTTGGRPWT